jgi:hypothetical protein
MFYNHPLYEAEVIRQVIELVDVEGAHPDRPIIVQDPSPVSLLVYIRRTRDQCLVRLENDQTVWKSFTWVSKYYPKLLFDYFEQESSRYLNALEFYRSITSIQFFYKNNCKRYTLVQSDYGHAKWVRESTFLSYTNERIMLQQFKH